MDPATKFNILQLAGSGRTHVVPVARKPRKAVCGVSETRGRGWIPSGRGAGITCPACGREAAEALHAALKTLTAERN